MSSPSRIYDTVWQSFKKGDKAAFAWIYQQYIGALLNYGNKITAERTLIEDSIQDLFYELWESRERVSQTTSVKFYLFKALRYKIRHNATQFCNLPESSLADGQSDLASHPSHESELIGLEVQSLQMQHLQTILEQLPDRQKEAINLRYYHDFTNEQVAQIMGVNYQSACNLIYTALRKLKLNLQISVA